jgi:hypothetical protein
MTKPSPSQRRRSTLAAFAAALALGLPPASPGCARQQPGVEEEAQAHRQDPPASSPSKLGPDNVEKKH